MKRERLNQESFIEKAIKIHGNKFDYSKSIFKGKRKKIKIRCLTCGNNINVLADYHLKSKTGSCNYCNVESKKLTTEDFINKVKKARGNEFSFEKTRYINSKTKVKVFHRRCGKLILVDPSNLVKSSGTGCRRCSLEDRSKSRIISNSDFKKRCINVFGDEYDLSEANYINAMTKIRIKHNICGRYFYMRATSFLNEKHGCRFCAIERNADLLRRGEKEFIKKSRDKHGDNFDFSLLKYKNCNTDIKLICKKCRNTFKTRPNYHLISKTGGCIFCSSSKPEKTIKKWLDSNSKKHKREKKFEECVNPDTGRKLSFDFFVFPNVLIEFHGKQHFEVASETWGRGKEGLIAIQKRDGIKKSWAKSNNYQYHMIRYDENVIDRLEEIFKT